MEVSSNSESDAFAIVGGGKAQVFKMASTAHGFETISSTLYTNKRRAVVREYICNAADAHIEAGIPDTPVEVTLTDTSISFKDFGAGIHADNIADVFCTVFGSSKRTDGRQTGGFGLGSKAGFSISEHFTVISCHASERSMFAMHKGDEETDGMPGVKPMGRAQPTTESGLTVTLPISGPNIVAQFTDEITRVVMLGGMQVKLNGVLLPTRDYTEARERGYGMFARFGGQERIQVLLGNVTYPLTPAPELTDVIRRLNAFTLESMDLVFCVPASSVKPTPSREALSYNRATIETLVSVMTAAANELEAVKQKHFRKVLEENLKKHCTRDDLAAIFSLKGVIAVEKLKVGLTTPEAIARRIAEMQLAEGRIPAEELKRMIPRMFPQSRSHLTQFMRTYKDPYDYSGGKNSKAYTQRCLQKELVSLKQRRMFRFLVQAGLPLTRLFGRNSWGGKFSKIGRGKAHMGRSSSVVIAPNYMVMTKATAGDDNVYTHQANLTPADHARIKEVAAKFGIKVSFLDPIDRVVTPRVAKVKAEKQAPLFSPFRTFNTVHREYAVYWSAIADPSVEKPSAMIAFPTARADRVQGVRIEESLMRVPEFIDKVIPNVVMARLKSDVDLLTEMKVPRLEAVVLQKLRARLKKPASNELLIQWFAENAADSYHSIEFDWRAPLRRYCFDREMAFAAFGEPYKASADQDEAWALWRAAHHLFSRRGVSASFYDGTERTAYAVAKDEFDALSKEFKDRDKLWNSNFCERAGGLMLMDALGMNSRWHASKKKLVIEAVKLHRKQWTALEKEKALEKAAKAHADHIKWQAKRKAERDRHLPVIIHPSLIEIFTAERIAA